MLLYATAPRSGMRLNGFKINRFGLLLLLAKKEKAAKEKNEKFHICSGPKMHVETSRIEVCRYFIIFLSYFILTRVGKGLARLFWNGIRRVDWDLICSRNLLPNKIHSAALPCLKSWDLQKMSTSPENCCFFSLLYVNYFKINFWGT